MKTPTTLLPVLVLLLSLSIAKGQQEFKPHLGYIYPAGAQQGRTVYITATGQHLRNSKEVYVSGTGVTAIVFKYFKPVTKLNKKERALLRQRMNPVRDKRLIQLLGQDYVDKLHTLEKKHPRQARLKGVKMPDHPLLFGIEDMSIRQLAHMGSVLALNSEFRNRQLAESLVLKVTVDDDAEPGSRQLRVISPAGATNPMTFQIGSLPERTELEPNNTDTCPELNDIAELINIPAALSTKAPKQLPGSTILNLPVTVNGQIMSRDVDKFRFRAAKNQKLVIQVQARSLVPFLADAVPGWFQATIAIYDSKGDELAFADDFRFNPDPVLYFMVPADGEYELEIRDSLYRGRLDFVYRISVSEEPFITHAFPLGTSEGKTTTARIYGWNLPCETIGLEAEEGVAGVTETSLQAGNKASNPLKYSVDSLPEIREKEDNNNPETCQKIILPVIINGQINETCDVDMFALRGRKGQKIVAEVRARRLNSPLDSIVRVMDSSGRIIAWNDDHVDKEGHLHRNDAGLLTHYADSYVVTTLPEDGTWFVQISDIQNQSGPEYSYRLRISEPMPDFELRATPSSLNLDDGTCVPVCVHALRKDGFNGPIQVALKDCPEFSLQGTVIPANRNYVRMTLRATNDAEEGIAELRMEGRATFSNNVITRPVIAADDVMQAFLYRHLVPCGRLLVTVQKTE
jgi:hypothetical protein